MPSIQSRFVVRSLIAAACGILSAIAFGRGNYLFGPYFGVAYGAITLGLLWIIGRMVTNQGRWPRAGVLLVVALSGIVGYVLAFPTHINPDVRVLIDDQATERAARSELTGLFETDHAFNSLSITTTRLKVLNITVSGSLGDRSQLDRLRSRIVERCPTVSRCVLHWNVLLRETGERVKGLESELFPAGANSREPRRGLQCPIEIQLTPLANMIGSLTTGVRYRCGSTGFAFRRGTTSLAMKTCTTSSD